MPLPPLDEAGRAHLDLTGDVPAVVVDATAWLDLATVPAVQEVLDAALALVPARLAVDLSQCELADAYALRVLERAARRAARQGTEVVLVGVDDRLARVLRLTGLDAVLPVVERVSA